jgi:twitching motility protein PilJ
LVGAAALSLVVFRAFTQQARHIATLTAQLKLHTSPSAASNGDGSQTSEGVSSALEQTLTLIQAQAVHLTESMTTMNGLAVSIERMAEHVALSATVAEQALTNAQHGTTAVQDTVQGIQRMRIHVQDTAKRIKHLDEHAQEVSEIGERIADMADHTGVLALNVSVQAARAGDMGQDAAVVAAEMEYLTGHTVEATKRIAHVVHTIQRETNEVVTALEGSTKELAQWVEASRQVGQALGEIEQTSVRLTELIQSISQVVAQQASSSAALSKTMDEMSTVTQQTVVGTKQVAASLSHLTLLVGTLRGSVNTQRRAA